MSCVDEDNEAELSVIALSAGTVGKIEGEDVVVRGAMLVSAGMVVESRSVDEEDEEVRLAPADSELTGTSVSESSSPTIMNVLTLFMYNVGVESLPLPLPLPFS